MAVSVILIASGGLPDQRAYLAVAASALIIICAPPQARRLVPLVTAAIGVAGAGAGAVQYLAPVRGLAVGKHSTSIFAKLDLAPSTDDNRRVLAVLAFLNS